MFLTHMALNPQRRSTRDLVSSPQRLHAAVLSAFVPGTGERGRILWRLDAPQHHLLDLYIVSPIAPSLEAMADQAGWPSQPEWRTADYDPFLGRLEGGQRWAFRLRANPVKNVPHSDGGRGQRMPLHKVPDQLQWLDDRAPKHGFRVADGELGPNVRIAERGATSFARRSDGERRTVTLTIATYEGVLEVEDPSALRASLVQGIGAAKGYGCGLMTLARLR